MEGVECQYHLKQLIAMKTADRSKPGVQSGVQRFFDNQLQNGSTILVLQILKLTKKLQIASKVMQRRISSNQIGYGYFATKSITSILLLV
jgi:hypothetical protein